MPTKKRLKRKKKETDKGKKERKYFMKKVILKTKATLKTMEKLFAKTMAIFVFLLAQSQNPNSHYNKMYF